MEFSGSREIAAQPEDIWNALLSPEVLAECIPGAQSVSGSADQGFTAEIRTGVGPMKIGFAGHITLDKMEPYTSMTLKGSGRGKIDVSLQDQGSSTLVSYMVSANLGGRFMRLGESVVSGFAKSVADRFFSRLEKSISSR